MKQFLPLLLLSLTATAPPRPPLTIAEVWAQRDQLDGKIIRAIGVLKGCSRWTCILAERSGPGAKYLSIGHPAGYDWETDPLKRHRLVVEGRFNAACLPENSDPRQSKIIVLCTDAAQTVLDSKIMRVL